MLYDIRKDLRRQGRQLQGIGRTISWPQSQMDSLLFVTHRVISVRDNKRIGIGNKEEEQ